MQEFQGDLLIGGMRLRHIHGELEQEQPDGSAHEWMLTGHLHLSPEQSRQLETDRRYRLVLEDGRAATVVLSRITPEKPDELLVDFEPPPRAAEPTKPR
jgi:hypothetical protein